MSLKSTQSEKNIFSGCIVSGIIGTVLGGAAGFLFPKYVSIPGPTNVMAWMTTLIGSIVGLFIGGVLSMIVSFIRSKQEKDEEEF